MEKIRNFRDFGGYPAAAGTWVRRGLLFRSGDLEKASARDLRSLESLGIKTVIDLRSAGEKGRRARIPQGARLHAVPFDGGETAREEVRPLLFKRTGRAGIEDAITRMYAAMVDEQRGQVAEVLRILLCPESAPLLIHCRAGKDRTGFVCAVIHLALGVDTTLALEDYLRSNDAYLAEIARAARLMKLLTLGLLPVENLAFAFTVRREYLQTALDRMTERYGTISRYLEDGGARPGDIELLKARYLDSKMKEAT